MLSITPAHETTSLKCINPGGNGLLQQHACRLPLDKHGGKHAVAFGRGADLKILGRNATALGETDGSRSWLAVHKGLSHWRPLALLAEIGLAVYQILHLNHQAARRAADAHGSVGKAPFIQVATHGLLQLGKRQPSEVGREFLRTDLEQEGSGHTGRLDRALTVLEAVSLASRYREMPASESDDCRCQSNHRGRRQRQARDGR